MAAEKKLEFPVIAVNDTPMKRFFDNVHGTGESVLSSIMITTNTLVTGKYFVVAGYGFCGRGLARKAHGLGAKVVVTEVDPRRALEAHMDGYHVMTMDRAAEIGNIFVTTTGNTSVIGKNHFGNSKPVRSLKTQATSTWRSISHGWKNTRTRKLIATASSPISSKENLSMCSLRAGL